MVDFEFSNIHPEDASHLPLFPKGLMALIRRYLDYEIRIRIGYASDTDRTPVIEEIHRYVVVVRLCGQLRRCRIYIDEQTSI